MSGRQQRRAAPARARGRRRRRPAAVQANLLASIRLVQAALPDAGRRLGPDLLITPSQSSADPDPGPVQHRPDRAVGMAKRPPPTCSPRASPSTWPAGHPRHRAGPQTGGLGRGRSATRRLRQGGVLPVLGPAGFVSSTAVAVDGPHRGAAVSGPAAAPPGPVREPRPSPWPGPGRARPCPNGRARAGGRDPRVDPGEPGRLPRPSTRSWPPWRPRGCPGPPHHARPPAAGGRSLASPAGPVAYLPGPG